MERLKEGCGSISCRTQEIYVKIKNYYPSFHHHGTECDCEAFTKKISIFSLIKSNECTYYLLNFV